MSAGLQRIVVSAIFLASVCGLALRLFMLPHYELTYDEAATAHFAALPMLDLWGAVGRLETNPPLFYTLAGIGARLGLSPEWLRVVSILPDGVTIVVGGVLAWRLGGALAGVIAAWLIAGSATMIEVGLEARAYSLLALLGVLSVLLAARALRDGDRRTLFALGLCEVGALYTHNVAAIMVGALNGMALLCWAAGPAPVAGLVRRWLVTQALVAGAWLYWLPTVLTQTTGDLARFWIATPSTADLRYAVQKVVGLPWVTWPQPLADLVFAGFGALGLLCLVRRRGLDRWIGIGIAVVVLAGVPAVTWAISQWRPLMNGRVLLWLVPIHIVLVAVALGWLRSAGVVVAAVLVVAQVYAVPFWRPVASAEPWPHVAALLRERMQPGDAIVLTPAPTALLLLHYGWQPGPYAVFGRPDGRWYRDFPGTFIGAADVPVLATGQSVWLVTRRGTPGHDAAVARLHDTRSEIRLLRGGTRPDGGLDVSLLVPR